MNRTQRALHHRRLSTVLCYAFTALPLTVFAQSGIVDLNIFDGYTSAATAVSANGQAVVGWWAGPGGSFSAFRWTASGGAQRLGSLNTTGSHDITEPNAISADGAVVVGRSLTDSHVFRAFRWTQSAGIESLGSINGGLHSQAYGVNRDGSVIVGTTDDGAAFGNSMRAFRWTPQGGMQSLGAFNNSAAMAVSADGSVIVGVADDPTADPNYNTSRAFRWTLATGLVSLGEPNLRTPTTSTATSVSADGSVIAGWTFNNLDSNRAFRWTQTEGWQALGVLNGGYRSWAFGINGDGTVIVGQADSSTAASRGFRWTQAGMQTIEDWLRQNGVTVHEDATWTAYGVNSDGSVIVGQLENGHAFIARVSPIGSGLVTLANVQDSLSATSKGGSMALSTAQTVINGAHSRPLSRRVATGHNAFWMAGDWGRDDHGERSGDLGLAEVGLGRNFGPAQVNVSLGQTWAQQNLPLNGRAKTEGTYLLAEVLIPVSGSLWATLGGFGHWGSTEMRRAYLNAGEPDASNASPNVSTVGLRARLDWENAFQLARIDFAPYADLAYSEARLGAYTETGGGFPARFDSRKEKATEVRLGMNATRPLDRGLHLVGTLEAAHRFEKNGLRTSGEIIGLFSFDLDRTKNRQDWLRAGTGLEGPLAGGKVSLMINGTTQGGAPNVWLAANWQMAF